MWAMSLARSVVDAFLWVVSLFLTSVKKLGASQDSLPPAAPAAVEVSVVESPSSQEPRCAPMFGDLSVFPQEITIEIAKALGLADVASLGATGSAAQSQVWQHSGVWSGLAERAALRPSVSTREAFRQEYYRLDLQQLEALSHDVQDAGGDLLAEILKDLAHTAHGLMPSDGHCIVEILIGAAEQALQAHDPTHTESALAADRILHVVRRRDDVFGWLQRERLECARSSAVQLQALMEDLVDKAPDSGGGEILDALQEAYPDADAFSTHEHLSDCMSPNFIATHGFEVDEQRLQDLCARFEDLCRQAGFASEDA